MTLPLPNLNAPVIDPKTGRLTTPWNSFFQQFTQEAVEVQVVSLSPTGTTDYRSSSVGTIFIESAVAPTLTLTLIRGNDAIPLLTGTQIVPMSIGDRLIINGFGNPNSVKFLAR